MPGPSRTLHLGDVAPEFALQEAAGGTRVDLRGLLVDRAGLLLVFHRGFW
jgi:hypothetical protein